MSILIVGGAGFIGLNLCRYLQRKNRFNFTVFDDFSIGDTEILTNLDIRYIKGSILDKDKLAKAMTNVDFVIHLAARPGVIDSIKNPQATFELNVTGAFNVLEQSRISNVSKIVFASTGGAIIGNNSTPPYTEFMPMNPISPYGASKMCSEGLFLTYARAYDMECYSLRFANVYGPYSRHKTGAVTAFMKAILRKKPLNIFGDGSSVRDFIYVEDVCEAIEKVLETNKASNVYNIGSGVSTSIQFLANAISDISDSQLTSNIEHLPMRSGEVDQTWLDISHAKNELGFTARTSLEAGLSKTWDWFQTTNSNGYKK